jgi:hypothetical protein
MEFRKGPPAGFGVTAFYPGSASHGMRHVVADGTTRACDDGRGNAQLICHSSKIPGRADESH